MKKGFTIVELLASIAIMALIIIISVPAYEGISKTIKEQNLNSKISMIEQATKSYVNKYHKDKVYDGNKNILLFSIPYLIEKNVISADDLEKNTISDPLNGGILKGYVKVIYDIDNYEIKTEYEEFSAFANFDDYKKMIDTYNNQLNKFKINNTKDFNFNEKNYTTLKSQLDNSNNKKTMIQIYKG